MEFAFEVALCARLEVQRDWVLARQLGAAVAAPGKRVIDVCAVAPGPAFDRRTSITDATIPQAAIESDVGVGTWVYWKDAFDCHPERARRATERAIEVGFFERRRRRGRLQVRQATRYPDWFDRLIGIENKPDLGTPGDLERQLRIDAALRVFDAVILATRSHVTRAHLNRIPDAVGVWQFDPDTGERTVIREPTHLPVNEPGIEIREERPLQTDVEIVSADRKARTRRRLAERAYGKGWRTYEMPACSQVTPTADGRPACDYHGRVVDPAVECGDACPGYDPAESPDLDRRVLRDDRTPWVADPDGVDRRQSGLDRFG